MKKLGEDSIGTHSLTTEFGRVRFENTSCQIVSSFHAAHSTLKVRYCVGVVQR